MIKQLELKQIDEVVNDSVVGTLICFEKDGKKKFPITFVSNYDCLLSFSMDMDKINMMRKDPTVLLKIFKLREDGGWYTINVLGIFEELNQIDEEIARCLLKDKLIAAKYGNQFMEDYDQNYVSSKIDQSKFIFKINIIKKSGRSRRL